MLFVGDADDFDRGVDDSPARVGGGVGGFGGVLRPGSGPVVVGAGAAGLGDGERGEGSELPRAVVVVGATPRAERFDRPIAYAVAKALDEAMVVGVGGCAPLAPSRAVLVCTDVWYLNDDSLSAVPVVSVGGFAANALSAWMRDKLETIAGEDGWYAVQADDRRSPMRVVVWGTNAEGTARAAEVFTRQLLGEFVYALTR